MTLYLTKDLAQRRLKKWINMNKECYAEDNEATVYYDTCTCGQILAKPCTYQEYLKAGDWAGLKKMYIQELEVEEELQ